MEFAYKDKSLGILNKKCICGEEISLFFSNRTREYYAAGLGWINLPKEIKCTYDDVLITLEEMNIIFNTWDLSGFQGIYQIIEEMRKEDIQQAEAILKKINEDKTAPIPLSVTLAALGL